MPVNSKVAIVADALPILGGSEKVLIAALELFPDAPIYTLLYNRAAFSATPLADRKVVSSLIEKLPLALTQYRKYLPLMPLGLRQFDLSQYETILSFSYAVAHGVNTRPGQVHFSYTFTPMRYAWRNYGFDGMESPSINTRHKFLQLFRDWDARAARRVDHFAAVSGWIAHWIKQAYQRDSTVIYPPVDIDRFSPAPQRSDYFITISRLVPHKRIDLVVEAFNRLDLPLIIVGDGPEYQRLCQRASSNIRLVGYKSNQATADLLDRARAYICPGEEDFGIAMVEAQAAGCPVIAYGRGGACEIVKEGQTGIFFHESNPESLVHAVERFIRISAEIHPCTCAGNAQRFSKARFQTELRTFMTNGTG